MPDPKSPESLPKNLASEGWQSRPPLNPSDPSPPQNPTAMPLPDPRMHMNTSQMPPRVAIPPTASPRITVEKPNPPAMPPPKQKPLDHDATTGEIALRICAKQGHKIELFVMRILTPTTNDPLHRTEHDLFMCIRCGSSLAQIRGPE